MISCGRKSLHFFIYLKKLTWKEIFVWIGNLFSHSVNEKKNLSWKKFLIFLFHSHTGKNFSPEKKQTHLVSHRKKKLVLKDFFKLNLSVFKIIPDIFIYLFKVKLQRFKVKEKNKNKNQVKLIFPCLKQSQKECFGTYWWSFTMCSFNLSFPNGIKKQMKKNFLGNSPHFTR